MWVRQRGNRAGFALEPSAAIGIGRVLCRQYFKSHDPIETSVCSLIDFAHPAGTERGKNLIGAEAGTYEQGHILEEPSIAVY